MQPVEFFGDEINNYVVPIFSSKPVIAIGREHLDLVIDNAHDRYVERAAAEVENEHRLVLVQLIEPVGERGCGRFIDDLEDVQTGKLAGRDRRGALGIIEVSRHGNDCVGDRLIEILLGISL